MSNRCEICDERFTPTAERAEMYQVYNCTDAQGRPHYKCPTCGADNGLCEHVITVLCHAQCGLSRGYEVA